MPRADYLALGGHAAAIRPLDDILRDGRRVHLRRAAQPGRRRRDRPAGRLAPRRPPAAPPARADRPDPRRPGARPPPCAPPTPAPRARFHGLLRGAGRRAPRPAQPRPRAARAARSPAPWPRAVAPYRPAFITPMAAVAGAVADEVLAAHDRRRRPRRAPMSTTAATSRSTSPPATALTAAIAARAGLPDRVTVAHADPVRGIATSGWRGRSFSLGIADAVTVLARTAAEADAAATLIANAVDLPGHPAITRAPGGQRCRPTATSATAASPPPSARSRRAEIARALDAGARRAPRRMRARGLIDAAALFLQGEVRVTGPLPAADATRDGDRQCLTSRSARRSSPSRRSTTSSARRRRSPRLRGACLAVAANPFAGRFARPTCSPRWRT